MAMAQFHFALAACVAAACLYAYRRYTATNPMRGHLGACGRNTYLGVIRAGQGQLTRWHWGEHTKWLKAEATIPDEPVLVSPGTPLYGICRNEQSDGAVWIQGGFLHWVWQDESQWGAYKYSYDYTPEGMDDNTPLAATGRLGFQAIWWASERRMNFMHMGGYNAWDKDVVKIDIDIPISKGQMIHAWSRGSEADGVVWAGDGVLNFFVHEAPDWESWKHFILDLDITESTPLASCGRKGFYAVWWVASSGDKINIMHAGTHTDWDLTFGELEPTVSVTSTTPLSGLCAEGQFDGVTWEHKGGRHVLYEADPNFGTWVYETHPIESKE